MAGVLHFLSPFLIKSFTAASSGGTAVILNAIRFLNSYKMSQWEQSYVTMLHRSQRVVLGKCKHMQHYAATCKHTQELPFPHLQIHTSADCLHRQWPFLLWKAGSTREASICQIDVSFNIAFSSVTDLKWELVTRLYNGVLLR